MSFVTLPDLLESSCGWSSWTVVGWFRWRDQKNRPPMSAPTATVVTDRTSIGTKKLWSSSLVPSFVVPVASKFAAAIWVPLAGRV